MPSPRQGAVAGCADLATFPAHSYRAAAFRVLWLLTASAITVEVGLAVTLLRAHAALWTVGVVLTAYHVGYLSSGLRVIAAMATYRTSSLSLAVIILVVGILQTSYLVLAIGALLFSTVTQWWRRQLKPIARTRAVTKNVGKAVGMLAASAFALPAPMAAGVMVLLSFTILAFSAFSPHLGSYQWLAQRNASQGNLTGFRPLLWAEALHHAHYFTYVYTFWVLISVPSWLIGPSFIIGWVGYFVAERFLRERHRSFAPWWFVGGHLMCAGTLAIITLRVGTIVDLIAWAITGVGGGTAYMLGNARPSTSPQLRERFEDAGHVVGCVLAATTATVSPLTPIFTAVGLAVSAAAAMLVYIVRSPKEAGT